MANGRFSDLLKNSGFRAFLGTQFLGAFNDQIYQAIVALYALKVHGGAYVPLVPAVFNLPFFLFSGYSGHLSDRISKRSVLIGVKVFEIFVMAVGLASLLSGRLEGMLLVVFLMGLHSTIFSPAKYGIVPEILADKDLSRGNALLEMSTFLAVVLGIVAGMSLYDAWSGSPWRMGAAALAVSAAGLLVSFGITRVPAAGSSKPFRLNPFAEIGSSTKRMLGDRPLWLAVLGVSFFWFTAVLMRNALEYFGADSLRTDTHGIGILWMWLAVGIGFGNMLAGRWSGDKVELGLVPLGSGLMGVFAIALYAARESFTWSAVAVALLAVASGLFAVPLFAFVQQRSGGQEKGRVVAANNFYQTVAMLIASGLIFLFYGKLHVSAAVILLGFGVVTLAISGYVLRLVPEYLVRFTLWLATHTFFRIRIVGAEHVPQQGPALLVANHMSHADGFLIAACVQRFIRFMVWKPYYEMRGLNRFFRLARAIPVGGSRREMVQCIHAAREALSAGETVCIFAEGAISRTGNMLPFKRGMEKIVAGLEVPVIPVHLDRMWGSIFSFERGKFFWKIPKRIPYPATVSFGAPMPSASTAFQVRQALQELSSDAWERRKAAGDLLDRRFIRNARCHWGRRAMADSTGRELSYGRLLAGAILMARCVRRLPGPINPGDSGLPEAVGVMLPASVAGALVNVGVTLAGRVPVNLNFTAGPEAMASAVEQCRIRSIITSRAFLEKAKIARMEGMVFVEDILAGVSKAARLSALIAARLAPARLLCAGGRTPDSPAAVIFSSGSTGVPKGIVLSHYSVISNIEAMAQIFWIGQSDGVAGILPFFHSFGFTVTLWFPLVAGCSVAYHPNPNEARAVGDLVAKYKAALLIGTPTFCLAYVKKCAVEDFSSLRYVLVGAEKLREPVAAAFREKFGKELLEGYGCTEMSPVVAVNTPDFEAGAEKQVGNKPGTVGHPMPGVAARIVDPVTFDPLPPNHEGLLLVKGPNRMTGYLGAPQRTEEVFHDGWYVTGDIALIDDEGFIRITDRLSRFSKIGGEMVPHMRIEDAISKVIGGCPCAVTSIADDRRGERLAALYACPEIGPAELWRRLAETDLPRLWLPKQDHLYQVDALPQLGTGKLDLRGVKCLAQELAFSVREHRAQA